MIQEKIPKELYADRFLKNNTFVFSILIFIGYLFFTFIAYPNIFIEGRIWAEEGVHWLWNNADKTPLEALFYLQFRKLELFPNIATSLSLLFPLRYTPFIYTFTSLIPPLFLCFSISLWLSKISINKKIKNLFTTYMVVFLCGGIIAINPLGKETLLNTINSWGYIVTAFAILIPFLKEKNIFFLGFIFPLISFPCTLFLPYSLAKYTFNRSRKNLFFLVGLSASTFIQFLLINFGKSNTDLIPGRDISLKSFLSSFAAFFNRTVTAIFFHSEKNLIQIDQTNFNIKLIIILNLFVISLILIANIYLLNKSKFNFFIKTCKTNKELFPLIIVESILPITTFTFFALFLSLGGSSMLLISNGGGLRYFFPFYATFLIISLVYLTLLNNDSYSLRRINIRKNLSYLIKIIIISWLIIGFMKSYISIKKDRENPMDWWCFFSRPSISKHIKINTSNRKDQIRGMEICPIGWSIPED